MQKLIANDPETCSADIVAENIEHLKALFPEVFTEGKIPHSLAEHDVSAAEAFEKPFV